MSNISRRIVGVSAVDSDREFPKIPEKYKGTMQIFEDGPLVTIDLRRPCKKERDCRTRNRRGKKRERAKRFNSYKPLN